MNVTSCNDIIQMMQPTSELLHIILPNVCGLIENAQNKSLISPEEEIFYRHCCIPKVFTNDRIFTKALCQYMEKNQHAQDEIAYHDLCVRSNRHASAILNPEFRLLTFIVLSVLTPVGFFANSLILLTVYKIKHLRNTTGYFICNLAVSDLLVIFQLLLFVATYASGAMSDASQRVQSFVFPTFDVVIGSSSLLHVTAVTIERGIAVSMPLRYPRYVNGRTANRTIIGIWVYCLALLVMGLLRVPILSEMYNWVFFFIAATLSFFIPCVLVIISYGLILVSAYKNIQMEKKISKDIVLVATLEQDKLDQVTSMRPARFREIKIAFNVALMTIPFVCGWGYFMACTTYEIVTDKALTGFQNWLIPFVPFIISCLNPLTYLMFTRSLRKNSLMLLSKSKLCNKLTSFICRRENERNSYAVCRQL